MMTYLNRAVLNRELILQSKTISTLTNTLLAYHDLQALLQRLCQVRELDRLTIPPDLRWYALT